MENEAIHTAQVILVTFSTIFLVGAVTAKIADLLKIPDVVLYLFAGIVIGPPGIGLLSIQPESTLNQITLTIGASFLLFHGGMEIKFSILKKVWLTILLLSTVAVLIMVAVVGYAVHVVLGIELVFALLLAAVLAPTDPATLVPIFLSVRIRDRLAQTILSESAFNDATGAIITFTLLSVILTGQISLIASIGKFLLMAVGGILIGAVFGLLAGLIVSNKANDFFAEYVHVLILPLIVLSYITAEHFGASGFMAVFIAGMMYGNLDTMNMKMKEESKEILHSFINSGSLLLRISIFIILGTHVDFSILQHYFLPGTAIIMIFIFVARPLAVLVCTLPDRWVKWDKNEILFMFWTRETGVIPAALSGMLVGMGIPHADMIASITFMAILSTLLIQATTTKWLANKLSLLEKGSY